MSLSTCDYCGGHGPDASNRCTGCGRRNAIEHDPLPPVVGIDDSELVALRAEVANLRKVNEALKNRERDRWTSAASAFGDRYSTVFDQWKNMPMPNFGTHGPGFF